jgi:uncharacterized membrane protein YesL
MKLDLNGRFFEIASKIADLIELNLLFILTSLPIFTIGASTCAMMTVLIRDVRGDKRPVAKSYFKAFGENFGKTTVMWIIDLVFLSAILFDYMLAGGFGGIVRIALRSAAAAGLIVVGSLVIYEMSWTGLIENSIGETIRNSFILTFSRAPYSLLMTALWISPPIMMYLAPEFLKVTVPVYIFIWPVLMAFADAYLMERVLRPYLGEPE